MNENYADILNESKFPITSANVFQAIFITSICFIITWYVQFHWKRKRLYQLASKLPGPFCLPFFGNSLYFVGSTTRIYNNIIKITSSFPSPVRIWLGTKLVFAIWEPYDMETVMTSPYALKKEELYKFTMDALGEGLVTAPVPKWKLHRRLISPTFNQKVLDGYVEIFSENANILVKILKNQVGKGSFEVFDYLSRFTLDSLCETAMGISVHAQTTDSNYVNWTNRAMQITSIRIFNMWYHWDFIFNLTSLSREFKEVIAKISSFTDDIIRSKQEEYQKKLKEKKELTENCFEEEPRKKNSFLNQLLELSENGANFTIEEIRDEVTTFMIAGSDTTASIDCDVLMMLGMFPDIQQKVYEEVMDVLGPDRSVEYTDLANLKYLDLVLKETMRILPTAAVIVREATRDIELRNCTIPAHSSIALAISSLHRNPEVWPDPLKFIPERFLPDEVAKRHPYSWVPFSGGPRNCIGFKYATMAMKTVIATVIRKYKVSTDYKCIEDITLKTDIMLKPINGYNVSIELRN